MFFDALNGYFGGFLMPMWRFRNIVLYINFNNQYVVKLMSES